jgi:hypothetical protein
MKTKSYKHIAWTLVAVVFAALQFAMAHGGGSGTGGGLPG